MSKVDFCDSPTTRVVCDTCLADGVVPYYTIGSRLITFATLCAHCFENKDITQHEHNMFLVQCNYKSVCRVCRLTKNSTYSLIHTDIDDEFDCRTFVCQSCISTNVAKLIELLNWHSGISIVELVSYSHYNQAQNYFAALSKTEQNIVKIERNMLCAEIKLPKILQDIILSYFWVFEN